MANSGRGRRKRYIWLAVILIFVVFPLFSVIYPFLTKCTVASVLIINRSGQDVTRALFTVGDRPVRRQMLVDGEWEWFAVPMSPEGKYFYEHFRFDVTLADGTNSDAKNFLYIESPYPDSYVGVVGVQQVEWSSLSAWIVPVNNLGPLGIPLELVESVPHALACMFGNSEPQPGL